QTAQEYGTYGADRIAPRVTQFIEDMAGAYAWADLIICRSGALTVSELAAAGLGALLVPYPSAVDDRQTPHARSPTDADAAVRIPDRDLEPHRLADELTRLCASRIRLLDMARAARSRAVPDATEKLAQAVLRAAGVLA